MVNGFDLDDQQMKILAETLHHLETLHLSSHYPPIDCPQITFEGLKSVVLHCLKLKDLAMTFNASSITGHSNHGDICNVNTRTIHVGYSPMDDPLAVLAFLSAIFPNLRQVHCTSRDSVSEPWLHT